MTARLEEIIETFASVDDETRLQLLLDYSRKLPDLPERFHAELDEGVRVVPECMTPVSLWVEPNNGSVGIFVHVGEEAPTVRGFLSILIDGFADASPGEILSSPTNLIQRLGLSNVIRMTRFVGLSAILGRIRKRVGELTQETPS